VKTAGLLALALVAVLPGLTLEAQPLSQASGVITTRVEIANDPLVITPVEDLGFGQLVPGTPSTVNPRTAATAGKFEIRGVRRAEFTFDLTLPVELRVGPHTIPLTFGNTAACHAAIDNQNACSQFDPGATLTTRIRNRPPPDNTHFVWLGGIASPSPTQFPGIYTATVIATVQYTGN
jgi:hypothetical protein